MSILDSLQRGWWSGWAEFPELISGGAGLLESLIPGDRPDDPLERLQRWGEEAAQGLRSEGGGGTPEGLLEKIAEGVGAAPGTVASYAPFFLTTPASMGATAAGAIARPAIAFGSHALVRHGDEGLPSAIGHGLRGAAEGAIFGGIGLKTGKMFAPKAAEELLKRRRALTAVGSEQAGAAKRFLGSQLEETGINELQRNLGRRAMHGVGAGGFVGTMTGLHGGDVEDIAASATTMGLLGVLAGGKYREPSMTGEKKIAESRERIEEYAAKRGKELELQAAKEGERTPPESRPLDPTMVTDKEAFLRSKSPADPRRVKYDRDAFNDLAPENQKKLIDYWNEEGGHLVESAQELAASMNRGGLDSKGRVRHKVSAFDTYSAARGLAEIRSEQVKLEQRLVAAEQGGSLGDVAHLKRTLEALDVERIALTVSKEGTGSTAGSALNAIKLAKRGEPEWYEAVSRWEKAQGKEMSEQIKYLARLSDGNPELLARLGHAINTPKMWDYLQEYWINGLLSGFPTQAVNTSSNALRGSIDVAEKRVALEAEVRRGKRGEKDFSWINRAEAATEFAADLKAGWGAIKLFKPIVGMMLRESRRSEFVEKYPRFETHLQRSKLDHPTAAIPGTAGKIIRFPGQLLQAVDIYFKAIAGDRYAASKSYRMALEEFKSGKLEAGKMEARIRELNGEGTGVPHEAVLRAMTENAQRLTFTSPVGKGVQAALKVRDMPINVPLLGEIRPGVAVAPFVQTPWNVISQSIARSPLGALRWKSLKAKYDKGDIAPQEFYREVGATAMGTTLTAGLVVMAKAGLITGGGPVNQQDRQNLLATGWRPYSVKIGDTYWQMQRLEPFGTVLGMAGDIAEFGDAEDKTGKMIALIKDNMTDKSFLYGLESFAKAFANPEQFGSTYYRQMSGSIVPTFFSKMAQAIDPIQRHQEAFGATAGVSDAMAYRTPGVSMALPQRSTALGEPAEKWGALSTAGPVERGLGAVQSVLSPLPMSATRADTEVEQEFNRLRNYRGMPPTSPRRTKKMVLKGVTGEDVKLTDAEYEVYNKFHQQAKQHLSQMISSARWASIPDPLKAKMMRSVYDKYRRAANDEITVSIRRRTSVGN